MFTEDNWIPDTLAEALRERLREKSSASTSPYSTFQLTKSSNGVGYCAFDGKNLPSVNLPDYLRRIAQYSGCTPSCLVAALVLVDRTAEANPGFVLTEYNVHRVILASVVVAIKFYEDTYYPNSYYARVGGVSGAEMNGLELQFLCLAKFNLFITATTFTRYASYLAPLDVSRPLVPFFGQPENELTPTQRWNTHSKANSHCTSTMVVKYSTKPASAF